MQDTSKIRFISFYLEGSRSARTKNNEVLYEDQNDKAGYFSFNSIQVPNFLDLATWLDDHVGCILSWQVIQPINEVSYPGIIIQYITTEKDLKEEVESIKKTNEAIKKGITFEEHRKRTEKK